LVWKALEQPQVQSFFFSSAIQYAFVSSLSEKRETTLFYKKLFYFVRNTGLAFGYQKQELTRLVSKNLVFHTLMEYATFEVEREDSPVLLKYKLETSTLKGHLVVLKN
jgi:hypothetical protein